MNDVFVIMSYRGSPIHITYPKNHGYVHGKKQAIRVCAELNKKAISNTYYFEKLRELK